MGTIAPGTQGKALTDTPEDGAPIQIGGSVDNVAIETAAEGDVRRIRVTGQGYLLQSTIFDSVGASADATSNSGVNRGKTQGDVNVNQRVQTFPLVFAPDGAWDRQRSLGDVALDGLGQLCVATAVPGSGVITTIEQDIISSTTRATIITPSSGARVRIVAVMASYDSTVANRQEFYFGTGANIFSDLAKAIIGFPVISPERRFGSLVLQDGSGPVGAVDEVVSIRTGVSDAGRAEFYVIFREE